MRPRHNPRREATFLEVAQLRTVTIVVRLVILLATVQHRVKSVRVVDADTVVEDVDVAAVVVAAVDIRAGDALTVASSVISRLIVSNQQVTNLVTTAARKVTLQGIALMNVQPSSCDAY